jgi:hypothetical protein
MVKALRSLICAGGTIWLVYTFGVGMLVAVGAMAAAIALLAGGDLKGPDAPTRIRQESHHTTRRAGF